jgi:galactokinase
MIEEARLLKLQALFEENFGSPDGTHLVRAPGRVNLIGEHTDYNGLPVLPIALPQDIAILFRPRFDSQVRMVDTRAEFGSSRFELQVEIPPSPTGEWVNYVKAAGQALTARFGLLRGADAVISGEVPRDAGLSSSSAMVVASALMIARANGLDIDRLELMDMLARGEHYVGTRGGGMDQAICMGGERQKALKIDFFPLRLEAIPIPEDWRFVVAHSLVVAQKTGDALEKYNARPRECREALSRLNESEGRLNQPLTLSQMLDKDGLSTLLEQAARTLEPVLLRRLRHAATEGIRVVNARNAMLNNDLKGFGRLMSESHRSMRDDLEASCPELDELVTTCLQAGARGSRMTGAGFGGCTVSLCHESEVSSLIEFLETNHYRGNTHTKDFPSYLFVAEPSDGAEVVF